MEVEVPLPWALPVPAIVALSSVLNVRVAAPLAIEDTDEIELGDEDEDAIAESEAVADAE